MSTTTMLYIVAGYLSGSVLFARLAAAILGTDQVEDAGEDRNPGAANAFRRGFWCGIIALVGDLGKAFWPVFCYCRFSGGLLQGPISLALVIAAPVVGHALPLWHHFKGGKGISASFGSLMGLFPFWQPAVLFAVIFVFFSVVLRIDPHFYRTAVTYLATAITFFFRYPAGVWGGFALISGTVLLRLHWSKERRAKPAVKLLWMR